MVNTVFFLSGVPRSGSTVLASLLNQNPDFTVTQTSPVLDTLQIISSNWPRVSANVLDQHPDQLINMLNGTFNSSYSHLITPYVIDKHRGWPRSIDYIQNITGKKPKIICTTRDISEIISSFLILFSKSNNLSYVDRDLITLGKPINTATRARHLWEGYINVPWTSLKVGYEKHSDCMLFVDYTEITQQPKETLEKIYNFLEVPVYSDHKFTELTPMHENDTAWGVKGLHHIRPTLKKTSPPASDILGKDLADYYNSLKLEFWK